MWRRAIKEERQKEKILHRDSLPFASIVFPGTCLEAEAQPQTNGPAIIDALVLIALVELSEKRVWINLRNRQELPGNRVNI
jgi:hypothetical protein